jgi:peptidoglycan/LPS O-acetylase OafA/YrhL
LQLTLILLFFGVSFLLSRLAPEFAFYMVVSRAWEFLIGSTLALRVMPALRDPRLNALLAGVGLALILASFALPPADGWFPAPMALLPCLGTAFVIHAGRGRTPQ